MMDKYADSTYMLTPNSDLRTIRIPVLLTHGEQRIHGAIELNSREAKSLAFKLLLMESELVVKVDA